MKRHSFMLLLFSFLFFSTLSRISSLSTSCPDNIWSMQLGQKFSQPPVEDLYYAKARSMLSNLGLQNYEKNFKKGLLTDSTLPLLTDRYC